MDFNEFKKKYSPIKNESGEHTFIYGKHVDFIELIPTTRLWTVEIKDSKRVLVPRAPAHPKDECVITLKSWGKEAYDESVVLSEIKNPEMKTYRITWQKEYTLSGTSFVRASSAERAEELLADNIGDFGLDDGSLQCNDARAEFVGETEYDVFPDITEGE